MEESGWKLTPSKALVQKGQKHQILPSLLQTYVDQDRQILRMLKKGHAPLISKTGVPLRIALKTFVLPHN